ncbi:MAG: DNA-protecting protein DprA [Candidatus Vogelbacteria bacterium]|nr:DNA-protecting protein DprA [Candidatus Vogelbacteria bacterium]
MIKVTGKDIPARLLEIPEPPKQLYIKGELPEFSENKYLTVVGSRHFSNYGKFVCEKLISGLRGYPIVIVSGMAIGMDTIAHRSALSNNLKTVAVPGSGLDKSVLYPRTNVRLAEEIVSSGGALLSEFEPKETAKIYSFPRRNRIEVGLADAILVIEAGQKSGTLITARLSVDYNRTLLVVPGPIFSPHHEGSNQFLRLGATPVLSSEDILDELGFDISKKNFKLELSDSEQIIFKLISEPRPRDAIIKLSGLPVQECNILLMQMEIKGLIKEMMGEIRIA